MKFICVRCESFMTFENVEVPGEQSLGVTFGCSTCGSKVAMITNPGETAMVNALGVKIGGRTTPPAPMEVTRESLMDMKPDARPATPSAAVQQAMLAKEMEKPAGGTCPFSSMIAQMKGEGATAGAAPTFTWTADATARLERVPSFMRPMIQMGVENYARKNGITTITPEVMDRSKNDPGDLNWSAAAERRLDNIPAFVRPMAKKEIERIARERGMTEVSEALMEESKSKFLGMGY